MGFALAGLLCGGAGARAQAPAQNQAHAAPSGQPVILTLDEAIRRAESSDVSYASAVAVERTAALDRNIAYGNLLPSVVYHNQGLYTQPNGLLNQAGQGVSAQPAPRFIANNAVREYASQASVDETLGVAKAATVLRAQALAAQADAEREIARRGLVAAVVALFYQSIAADHKQTTAESSLRDAAEFTKLTQEREQAREAAHADAIKAELVEQQRTRELQDARAAAEKARLELGVLLFADPRTAFALSAPKTPPALASREDVAAAAAKNNPELRSALDALAASNAGVMAAWGAYLPDLGLNYTYGIDAPQFAANGPDGVRNLGYSAMVTVDIPLWNWFNTQRRVKQSKIARNVAKVSLDATQRQLIARLDEAYTEAATARDELASLDLSVQTAAESLRLTRMAYANGEATVLEVVDAQNTYVAAGNAREDGRVRYETARANLQTLTGTMEP